MTSIEENLIDVMIYCCFYTLMINSEISRVILGNFSSITCTIAQSLLNKNFFKKILNSRVNLSFPYFLKVTEISRGFYSKDIEYNALEILIFSDFSISVNPYNVAYTNRVFGAKTQACL